MSGEDAGPPDGPAPDDPHRPWRPPGWTPADAAGGSTLPDAPVRRLTPPELIWSPASLREPIGPAGRPESSPPPELPLAAATVEVRRRRRPRLRTVAAGVGVAALIAVPTATVVYLRAAGGTGDVLVGRAVPGSVALYATLRLDPSLSTKEHLRDFLDRFPAVHNDASSTVTSWVRNSVRSSGLDYDRDVQPWLGTQIAAVGMTGTTSGYAALLASTDDDKAKAALRRSESVVGGQDVTWSTTNHGGVEVNAGTRTPPGWEGYSCSTCTPSTAEVWAVVDHVVVIGSGVDVVNSVIDTAQGRSPSLGATSLYRDTMSRLSGDRIAEVFVNAAPLLDTLHRSLAQQGGGSAQPTTDVLKSLDAYRSAGMALTVGSDHIDVDGVALTTPAGLASQANARGTSLASWLPASSVAVTTGRGGAVSGSALAGLLELAAFQQVAVPPRTVTGFASPPGRSITVPGAHASGGAIVVSPGTSAATGGQLRPSSAPVPQYPPVEFTQPSPAAPPLDQQTLAHLTGPSAAAAWAAADGSPRAALVLTGDGGVDLSDTLDRVLRSLSGGSSTSCSPVILPTTQRVTIQCSTRAPTASRTELAGVTITSYGRGAWAVADGVGILGTSPAAVADVLVAHSSGDGADRSSGFGHSAAASADSGFWVDVQASIGLIRSALGSQQESALDSTMSNLRPLKTLVAISGGDPTAPTVHIELTVG